MKQIVIKILEEIEELLKSRKYKEALDELRKIDHSSLCNIDYGHYCILLSEACLKLGDYSVEEYIDNAIEIYRVDIDTEKFARAKFLKARLLSLLGNHLDAEELFIESYSNYLRCKNLFGAAKILNYLSYCVFQTGKIEVAISNLEKCISIYKELNDHKNISNVLINLSNLFFRVGRVDYSIISYSKIESYIEYLNNKNILVYYEMSSIPFALKGDISSARKTITKAKPYLDEFPREKAIYFENLGLINILSGDYGEAEKALKKGLKISLEIAPESALISQIKRLFGDLYFATEKYDLAKKYTDEALVVAEKIGEKVEIAACYRIFAQLEHHNGNNNKAKEYYTKAIDLFKLIGSRYELAVTQYLAATSGLYHNGVRHAMLYMARDYFESENVTPYLEKIEKALKNPTAKEKLKPIASNGPTIIAVNPQMKKLVEIAENVAQSDMSVLLTGETGTGKDLMAEYIHHMSCREGDFVEVNCPIFSDGLFEAELFGSVKGAYTGAVSDRIGRVEMANNGTLFLNEVGDIPIRHQVKLLRVIETGEYEKVGSSKMLKVNCRVIAATNGDLEQRIYDGEFRADLYHRIKCIHVDLPPLNERREDTPQLIKFFLERNGLNFKNENGNLERVASLLSYRNWTGNVRQLENFIKKLSHDSGKDFNKLIMLVQDSLQKPDRDELINILESTNWNRSQTAELLGVSEGTIRNWIRKYDLLELIS
ncbi:MAG: sigma 54-interacting transcriptional regulator [Methanosarcinaceae archaeon]